MKNNTLSSQTEMVGIQPGNRENILLHQRFDTMQRLVAGYFHEIQQQLSVIIGQAELVENGSEVCRTALDGEVTIELIEKVKTAADEITRCVDQVHRVGTIGSKGFDEPVLVDSFLSSLPNLIKGYARHIRDTKNIVIGLCINGTAPGFSVQGLDIFDFILPPVLELMNGAVCSGELSVSISEEEDDFLFKLRFPHQIIGHEILDDFVTRIFQGCEDLIKPSDYKPENPERVYIQHNQENSKSCSITLVFNKKCLADSLRIWEERESWTRSG